MNFLDVFTDKLTFPEGPVALKDGSWLCVQGGTSGCVTHISSDGKTHRVIAVTGAPNGLAFDKDGFIWVAETKVPALLKISMGGDVEVALTSCGDEAFLYPNDLCFGPDGYLYLTDSGILTDDFEPNGKVRADYNELRYDGRVYRIHPKTKEIIKIDSGIRFTNGIAFGNDGYLYVNETLTGDIFRYRIQKGIIGKREVFGNVIHPEAAPGYKGPDGMAFSEDGLLYVTVYGQGDVTVLNDKVEKLERIKTKGMNPTNVAFALAPKKQIHVTEYQYGTMELFDVKKDGLALWD